MAENRSPESQKKIFTTPVDKPPTRDIIRDPTDGERKPVTPKTASQCCRTQWETRCIR
jgi:hypothetical protein